MAAKKPAEAEPKTMPEKLIVGAEVVTMPTPTGSTPAILYRGGAPKKGSVIKFTLSNGVTYSGKVADANEAEGEVLVEFTNGILPVKK